MTAGLAVLSIALYLFNVIDLNGLAQAILLMPCMDLAIYALRQMMVDALSEKTVCKKSKTEFTASGASYGTVLGIVLGALVYWAFSIPQPATTSEPGFTGSLFFGVPAMVGAVEYWIGKSRWVHNATSGAGLIDRSRYLKLNVGLQT